jgi:hypothetical protein
LPKRAWLLELAVVAALYVVYSMVRNLSTAGAGDAFNNALVIMRAQRLLGIDHELAWQQWALQHEAVIVAANYFYGTAYIVVTVGTLVWLYRRHSATYPLWRNTLVAGTLLALVGFAAFPLMPPRLMDGHLSNPGWAFVDTMATYPALWSFDAETISAISNQFAAMPSLHCGWAMWVGAAMWSHSRRPFTRITAVAYPAITVVVVVITGNHFFLDAVGGAAVMAGGLVIATAIDKATGRATQRRGAQQGVQATPHDQRWPRATTG